MHGKIEPAFTWVTHWRNFRFISTPNHLFLVLQYVQGFGDLFDLWRDEGPFSEEISCIFAAELALALDFMHNRSVIFRDLKLENVLLDENGHCQIVDFGLAKWLAIGDRTRTICGTLQYMGNFTIILNIFCCNSTQHPKC